MIQIYSNFNRMANTFIDKGIWILINGQTYIVNRNASIIDILKFLISKETDVIIEYNHKILFRENYKTTKIKEFDKLEFITIVGGG